MPQITARQRAGGTHKEPEDGCVPRLFRLPGHAKLALDKWVKGKLVIERHFDIYDDTKWVWEPQPHRNLADMEIVPVEIQVKETPDG